MQIYKIEYAHLHNPIWHSTEWHMYDIYHYVEFHVIHIPSCRGWIASVAQALSSQCLNEGPSPLHWPSWCTVRHAADGRGWYCHCNLAWPLRTTGWDSHRFGSMYAPLRVPQPIDDISLFSLSSFRRQPKKFWENAPACCDFWPPNHHFGLALLSAVNRRFVVPCTKEISLKVLIPSSFLQALVM
jgi:hypothetical protein